MKPIFHFLIAALIIFRASADPLADYLFPPELLVRAKEEVPLTDEQRQQLQKETAKVESRFREIQARMQKEADTLVALVKPGHVDEAAALSQLDKVIDAEREIKRAQIGFMIAIKNQLTPEQQAKLIAFRKAHELDRAQAEEFQKRLVAKAERVRLGVEKLVANGGDTTRVAAIMDEARKLMEQRKPKDAEAAIDRALKELGEEK
jgi:Spy/CpxP family protein refolding chaperone